MSASSLLSLGVRTMTANYAALQVTGHNIANASVEGYSRQQVELSTAQGQFTGAGFFGRGVNVDAVTRVQDGFLTREAATARSLAGMDQARSDLLQRLETIFPTGELGVGYASGQFLNAMVDLASRPADDATRQVVLARASETAERFSAAGQQLDALQGSVNEALVDAVKKVNQLATSIAQANSSIASLTGLGQSPNDLLDQRDRLVSQLSELVQVKTVSAADGSMAVFIGGGQALVLGSNTAVLKAVPDPMDASRTALMLDTAGAQTPVDGRYLGGGSIAGWLKFQDEDMVQARVQLGQLAAALAGVVNQQQALGLDLRTPPGSGPALFSIGAPQALPAATNQRDALGQFASQVTLTVTDPSQLAASEYDLRADPANPGSWTLRRLTDGVVRTVVDGEEVDGFRIDLGVPPPATTDRFLLQPVSRAANGMQRILDDPRGLAAASPVTASVDPANTGTAAIAALRVVDSAINPDLTANITFTNATGAYAWEFRDASNTVVSSGTGTWTPGQPIELNGFELDLNGVPAAGDEFSVFKTTFPRQNNVNALAFVALRETGFVGRVLQSDGSLAGGSSITDAYAATLANIGTRVQSARTAANISAAVASQSEQARANSSGVNLDEEAARLLQYQQSYQAAAKVLQVAQTVLDTLIQITGR